MTIVPWYLFLGFLALIGQPYLFSFETVDMQDQEEQQSIKRSAEQTFLTNWGRQDEGDELDIAKLSEVHLTSHNLRLYFGGLLNDDFFLYTHAYTLRNDYHDQVDFFRHKLHLDMVVTQGTNICGKPASQAGIRLKNYVFWQNEGAYTPITIDSINIPQLDNLNIAQNTKVRPLIPLIFVEQAWFKLNFDVFTDCFKDNPTFLKVGYFPYIVGRGVALGFHEDLAVDYLGWAGDGGFTRYPFMPPGILFRTEVNENLTWDIYFNLWRETNASLSDVLQPERASRLYGKRPERGSGKDRITWVTKLDFSKSYEGFGDVLLEPYFLYVDAPEQGIEFNADASSKLFTLGVMADLKYNNFNVNVEIAGQFGHQHIHAIDRNVVQITRSATGQMQNSFSHIVFDNSESQSLVTASRDQAAIPTPSLEADIFEPQNYADFYVEQPFNRDLNQQGEQILRLPGTVAKIDAHSAKQNIFNSETFGNNRFRNPYTLSYQSFMALADITYEFKDQPFKLAASVGHISGDNYPYNEEVSRHYNGFIPLRSRYRGHGIQNFFMFDRQVTPRPLNISYRTLYAFNDLKDLSNLQFIGFGTTWYPYQDRNKLSITGTIMWLWEAATLKKWDKNGKHPDADIEKQLKRLRNTPIDGKPTLFSGWEKQEHASRMLGTEYNLKAIYQVLDHCLWVTKLVVFVPGGLYKDLLGQPNQVTQRIDEQGLLRYDSLGHQAAFAFVTGLKYDF